MNKNLLQIHAKSFYWASFFLSKKIFYQCSVLYNFCRTLDDIVDSEKQLEIRKKEFSNFKNDFLNKNLNNQIVKEMWDLINSKNISKLGGSLPSYFFTILTASFLVNLLFLISIEVK